MIFNSNLEVLKDLEFISVINDSFKLKTITILAEDKNKQNAIIIIRKDPIKADLSPPVGFGLNINEKTFDNNEYSKYSATSVDSYLDSVNVEIISPAAEWQIIKYSRKSMSIFTESRDFYESHTIPYVISLPDKSRQWLQDVLEGRKEQEAIFNGVYSTNDNKSSSFEPVTSMTNPENMIDINSKFIIAKDYKWTDESNLSLLQYLAMPLRRDILSIRDLRSEHLPLLKAMKIQGINICRSKNLEDENVAMQLHYLPTFWHLHVHITHTSVMFESTHIARCILLDDVIDHLEMDDQYFVKKSFKISIFKEHPLYEKIKEDQKIIQED